MQILKNFKTCSKDAKDKIQLDKLFSNNKEQFSNKYLWRI